MRQFSTAMDVTKADAVIRGSEDLMGSVSESNTLTSKYPWQDYPFSLSSYNPFTEWGEYYQNFFERDLCPVQSSFILQDVTGNSMITASYSWKMKVIELMNYLIPSWGMPIVYTYDLVISVPSYHQVVVPSITNLRLPVFPSRSCNYY